MTPAQVAHATSVPKIILSDTINSACLLPSPSQYSPVWGCYIQGTDRIYINSKIPPQIAGYVLAHEIGHYYLRHITDGNLGSIINPSPLLLAEKTIKEIGADHFASWLYDKRSVSETEDKLFSDSLNEQ